jgi:holo-[acyl-carrier protein] synthase
VIIGIGVDEVEVARMAAVLERTPTFRRRSFTDAEIAYADRVPGLAAERFAVRFAAKEAVLKAMGLGVGACRWRDIEVARDPDSQQPWIELHGTAADLARQRGIERWHLSLSHTAVRATAFVVAEA